MNHDEIINELEDVNSKYYGGSLAYLQIEINLALLNKLLSMKQKKTDNSTYQKIKTISNLIKQQAHYMIEEDGEIFDKIRKAKSQEEKDEIIDKIYSPSLAFLENLNTIDIYLRGLIDETTSSLKYDYIMIKDSLLACYNNLVHILEFEVRKMSNCDLKEVRFGQIQAVRKEN